MIPGRGISMRIHILGPSGAGTSTLGRSLSERFCISWFDSDDFFWMPTDPPFSLKREAAERSLLLRDTLSRERGWVLSGSVIGWGDFIREDLDVAVYKYVRREERIRRLKARERERFGNRIAPGNDMHENHRAFIEWARGYEEGGLEMRSRASEEKWMSHLTCRIIRLETEMDIAEELEFVADRITAQPEVH